jgi:signal transduction histidine kinase
MSIQAPSSEPSAALKPLRLLHVEDAEVDHLIVQALVAQAGLAAEWLRVETVADFAAALAEPWDAVICDHNLPTASGLDMLRWLKESGLVLPFILVSGEIGEEAAVAAMREGASDYLLKDKLARLGPALQQAIRAAEAQRLRLQSEQALRVSEQRLQELARHLQVRVEAERAAMARELHDDVGSALTALKFDLAWLHRHAGDAAADARADRTERALGTLDLAIEASRRLMQNLRPPILQEGLEAALQWLVQHFERHNESLTVRLAMPAQLAPLDENRSLVVYRFVQEALHNVAKHARANAVLVEVQLAGGALSAEVRDDGCGLAPEALAEASGFGLRGLQERAAAVGAWVDVVSRPGEGTRLLLSMPLQALVTADAVDADWLEDAA